MNDATPTPAPKCPPVPLDDLIQAGRPFEDDVADAYRTGFTQGLAAAQRLAEEERQRGADEELRGCALWVEVEYGSVAAAELRAARRPPAPSLREQALALLRRRTLSDGRLLGYLDAAETALITQALEGGDG